MRAHAFYLIVEEAKEAHDVVSGTILVNSLISSVLFDLGVDFSFVFHNFRKKFDMPLVPLSEIYIVEVATGEHVTIR